MQALNMHEATYYIVIWQDLPKHIEEEVVAEAETDDIDLYLYDLWELSDKTKTLSRWS